MDRIVAVIETAGTSSFNVTFLSVSKDGMKAGEKILTSDIIGKMANDPEFPKIARLDVGK